MNAQLRSKVNAGCRIADTFVKLYYDCFHYRRQEIISMFQDTAVCVWNGNAASGKDAIQKHFSELPMFKHTITTLDVKPIVDNAVDGEPTYIIKVGGTVEDSYKQSNIFQQSFVITAVEEKWKIICDVYRLQDALASVNH